MSPIKNTCWRFLQVMASCYFFATFFLVSALLFPLAVILWATTIMFDKRRYLLHRATCYWADLILFINPYWKVTVEGRDRIDPSGVYVMVSNHQSGLDILVLFKLHCHFKWIAKKGLFAIPFIGWEMALNGYIPIERTHGRSRLMMMDKAASSIRDKNSVIFFPEGTRSADGRLQPFKAGAFRLAIETKSPILPVVIKGTHKAIKKGGLLIHRNRNIRLVVIAPVPYESFSHLNSKELSMMIHELTRQELDQQP